MALLNFTRDAPLNGTECFAATCGMDESVGWEKVGKFTGILVRERIKRKRGSKGGWL